MVDRWNGQFLLATKLTVPRSYAHSIVPRPRLFSQLEDGLRCPLLLLSAPAGFGKTTLLSSWLHEYEHATAWLSLDESDNQGDRFWHYCLAAILRTIRSSSPLPDERLTAIETLFFDDDTRSIETVLTLLINVLADWGQEFVLVLDDYQVITSPCVYDLLTFFLSYIPANVHVVLSSRIDPTFPLARWRVQGRLFELRSDDLLFTQQEIALLLHDTTRLTMRADDIATLRQRTEGWIAGLQLALISLQGRFAEGEASRSISSFDGSNRHVLHYLSEEVLLRLPEAVQEFLLQTSLLERLNASLCDAVTGRQDSELILAWLERANLFLSPSDVQGSWYHYHRLFIDLLRHRLQQQYADLVPLLHDRASRWYETQQMPIEAIEHAFQAQDTTRVVALLDHSVWSLWREGRETLIYGWLERLRDDATIQFEQYPDFSYFCAFDALRNGDMTRYRAVLSHIELAASREALSAYEAILSGDGERALAYADSHVALLPATLPAEGMVHLYRGVALLHCGEIRKAFYELIQGRHLAMRDQLVPVREAALLFLGHCAYYQGYLSEALSWYYECVPVTDSTCCSWTQVEAYLYMGLIYLEWDEVDLAEEQLRCARRLTASAHVSMSGVLPAALYLAAQLAWAQRNRNRAHLLLDQAEGELLHCGGPLYQRAQIALLRIRYWLMEGCIEMAVHWSEHMSLAGQQIAGENQLPVREQWVLAHAYTALAQQQPDASVRYLLPLLHEVRKQGRRYSELRILIVLAQAYAALNDTRHAKRTLTALLTIAQRDNYRRTLLDEGEPLFSLLSDLYRRQQKHFSGELQPSILEYVHSLLQDFGYNTLPHDWSSWQRRMPGGGMVSNRLSDRELEVLKLIAEGNSNQQIAHTLVVAESTIKTHLNNIYGKLNVNSRLQALTRAQASGILEL